MLLMPVGIINERHEPPVFYGVERPFVDTVIIPTTWFEVGAGVHGEIGRGWRYRAYVTSPLNAAEFTAEEGIREGRQKGAEANIGERRRDRAGRVRRPARPDRRRQLLDRRSGFAFRPRVRRAGDACSKPTPATRATASSCAASSRSVEIVNAGELNDALARPTRRESQHRAHAAGLLRRRRATGWSPAPRFGDIGAFVRYENFDTQFRMPDGYLPLEQFDREAWVVGATYWPDPDIAIKVDYVTSAQPQRRHRGAQLVQPRSRMVVLMRTRASLLVVSCSSLLGATRLGWSRTVQPGGAADADRRDHGRTIQLHAVRDQARSAPR